MDEPVQKLPITPEEEFKASFWRQVKDGDVITFGGYKLTINAALEKLWKSLNKI